MLATPDDPAQTGATFNLLLAAELQDDLLCASNDLDRLQALLAAACDALAASFFGAHAEIDGLRATAGDVLSQRVVPHLSQAIAALQFQDMASQLIAHTHQRLRNCADRLAAEAFDGGDDEAGATVITAAPMRPNPVTQDEMHAGSAELF